MKIKKIIKYILLVILPIIVISVGVEHYQSKQETYQITETNRLSNLYDSNFMKSCTAKDVDDNVYELLTDEEVYSYCYCVLQNMRRSYSFDYLIELDKSEESVLEFYNQPVMQNIVNGCIDSVIY